MTISFVTDNHSVIFLLLDAQDGKVADGEEVEPAAVRSLRPWDQSCLVWTVRTTPRLANSTCVILCLDGAYVDMSARWLDQSPFILIPVNRVISLSSSLPTSSLRCPPSRTAAETFV
jgi:hypothetical protein